jgi:hypothetical protein
MSETEKPFSVSDRRHFTPDGRVREETEPETPPVSDEPSGGATSAPPAVEPETTEAAAPPRVDERPESPPPGADPASGSGLGPADFSEFIFSLGAQAGMLLAGQGLPEGADPKEALEGARSIISILEMLRDKTDGRRTAREDEVIEGLLYELRMAYIEKSRAGGS